MKFHYTGKLHIPVGKLKYIFYGNIRPYNIAVYAPNADLKRRRAHDPDRLHMILDVDAPEPALLVCFS